MSYEIDSTHRKFVAVVTVCVLLVEFVYKLYKQNPNLTAVKGVCSTT